MKSAIHLLAERARNDPGGLAYRAKTLGLYEEVRWDEYAARVASCAEGYRRLGLKRRERVAIMGDACAAWTIADLGAQAAGAVTFGIYPTASAAEVEYQLRDADASIFVAEDQEYVDKVLPLLERLPRLRCIIVIDDSAMFAYDDDRITRFEELMAKPGDPLHSLCESIGADDPAFIVYTSGTTGHPKGALVTHAVHVAAAQNMIEHYPQLAKTGQRTVIYLPLCHILGRDMGITLPLLGGPTPHFGEDVEDLPRTLYEVAPTVLVTVPRYLQKFASQVLIRIGHTTALKAAAYRLEAPASAWRRPMACRRATTPSSSSCRGVTWQSSSRAALTVPSCSGTTATPGSTRTPTGSRPTCGPSRGSACSTRSRRRTTSCRRSSGTRPSRRRGGTPSTKPVQARA